MGEGRTGGNSLTILLKQLMVCSCEGCYGNNNCLHISFHQRIKLKFLLANKFNFNKKGIEK